MLPINKPNPTRGPYDHGASLTSATTQNVSVRRARSIPGELMFKGDLDNIETSAPFDEEGMRLDTARLQVQLRQMESLARDQDQRQLNMEITANGLAEALSTALQQVEGQTIKHQELLRRRQVCLEELNQRSQSFDNSQKALEITADALITQRERDTNQHQAEMQAIYQQTLTQ